MRLIFVIVFVISFLGACIVDPIEIEPEVNCDVESIVGVWEYHSSEGIEDSAYRDITIVLLSDSIKGDIKIAGRDYSIDNGDACIASAVVNFLNSTYELRSENELVRRPWSLLSEMAFIFKRKE